MEYFESPAPSGEARCSDNQCPCDETAIPVGKGYLYVPRDCCDFRWDCRSVAEVRPKIKRLEDRTNQMIMFDQGILAPILMCEVGARRRDLDLEVAARDAEHWWATSQVPLRPTPQRGDPEIPWTPPARVTSSSGGSSASTCFVATAAYGSEDHPVVQTLRDFRDRELATRALGRAFIGVYALLGPHCARFIASHPTARRLARHAIVVPVAKLVARIERRIG